jgi:hypothetical protein
MNTSFLTAVLASALLTGQNATPTWQPDYAQARQEAAAQKKPLAVVFGSGANGWTKVVRSEGPSPDVTKLLSDKYCCLYIDMATPAGKKLAASFAITSEVGMVISDRAGMTQAFWHQGDLTNSSMVSCLERYSNPQIAIRGTETTTRTSFYPTSASEETNWGAVSGGSYCPSCNNVRGRR